MIKYIFLLAKLVKESVNITYMFQYIYIKDIIELYIYIYNNHCKSERKAIGQQGNILHSEMSALFRYMVYRL